MYNRISLQIAKAVKAHPDEFYTSYKAAVQALMDTEKGWLSWDALAGKNPDSSEWRKHSLTTHQ